MVAQFLQKLTFEEVQTIVEEVVDLADKCKILKAHESPSECSHQLVGESCSVFLSLFFKLKFQPKGVIMKWGVEELGRGL